MRGFAPWRSTVHDIEAGIQAQLGTLRFDDMHSLLHSGANFVPPQRSNHRCTVTLGGPSGQSEPSHLVQRRRLEALKLANEHVQRT